MDISMLKEATSSDANPTPGYMLNEICRATITSYQACVDLHEFLVTRIKSNNANIKLKCLVITKHVCRSGRADFKKEWRKVDPIKGS
jgi:hypothetical protein